MGRAAHCTAEKRKLIVQMKSKKKSNSEIARILKCSRRMVINALKHVDQSQSVENKIRKNRPRKSDAHIDRKIHRFSTVNPFATSEQIKKAISVDSGLDISSRTVRRRLNEFGLRGCIAQRKPLITKRNQQRILLFAKTHLEKPLIFWKNVLWTDESKYNRFGSDGKLYVRRPKNQQFNPRYTIKTVKHGGGSIMVWGAISWYGVGPIVRIQGVMDRFVYKDILQNTMEPYADDFMRLRWTFMQDNDPKHTAGVVKEWFNQQKINVLDWSAQSLDLNPIENVWGDVEVAIRDHRPSNLDVLWNVVRDAWNSIPSERCRRLVESLPRRSAEVIRNKGFSTKY